MRMPISKVSRAIVAIVSAAVLAGAAAVWHERPRDDDRALTAVFRDASPLIAGNEVRMYGVKVGTVDAISLDHGQAAVRLKLDEDMPALHRDASAVIRPVSLLGERYIELSAGRPDQPMLPAPRVIPAERTSAAVDLDQMLNTLNDPTSAGLASMITTLGEGMQGNGRQAADALKALRPAMERTGELSDVLNQQNHVLTDLVDSASGIVGAEADNHGRTVDAVASEARRTLSTVADNQSAVNASLQQLPATLAKAQRTMANLSGAGEQVIPALQDIRPITDNLTDVSGELHRFAAAATPAFQSLPGVLEKLNGMLDAARPVVDQLGPASRDLRSLSGSGRALGETMLNHPRGTPSQLENLMTALSGWAMSGNGYDGISHYFRAVVGVTPETVGTLLGGALPPGALPQLGPGSSNGDRVPPDPNAPPQQPRAGTAGKQPAPAADPLSATNLTEDQEHSMLQQLLGGR